MAHLLSSSFAQGFLKLGKLLALIFQQNIFLSPKKKGIFLKEWGESCFVVYFLFFIYFHANQVGRKSSFFNGLDRNLEDQVVHIAPNMNCNAFPLVPSKSRPYNDVLATAALFDVAVALALARSFVRQLLIDLCLRAFDQVDNLDSDSFFERKFLL